MSSQYLRVKGNDKLKSKLHRVLLFQKVRQIKKFSAFFFTFSLRKYRLVRILHKVLLSYNGLIDPFTYNIYFRSFVSNSLTVEQKLSILLYHNEFIKKWFKEDVIRLLFGPGILCYSEEIASGHLQIILTASHSYFYKEGALSITLRLNQNDIYVMAFTIAPNSPTDPSDGFLIISRVQMLSKNYEEMKKVRKEMKDIAPEKLLLYAIEGMARALDIRFLVGIRTEDQIEYINVYDIPTFNKRYNAFWEQFPEYKEEAIGYCIPLPLKGKHVGEVSQNHRSRARMKHTKLSEISSAVGMALSRFLLSGETKFCNAAAHHNSVYYVLLILGFIY